MKAKTRKPFSNVVKVKEVLPAEAYDNVPRAQLTFTDEAVWLSRFDRRGQVVSTYPVNLENVARAFVGVPAASGLLPPRTLFWECKNNVVRMGIHLPAQTRTLHFQLKRKPEIFTIPLPGFVLVGAGKHYSIFAVADDALRASSALYRAPLPNVNLQGEICAGNVEFPVCGPDTLDRAAQLFFESYFNHDLANAKLERANKAIELIPFLRDLSRRRAKKFPREMLVPCGTLGALVEGRAVTSAVPIDDQDEQDENADMLMDGDGPDWGDPMDDGAGDFRFTVGD